MDRHSRAGWWLLVAGTLVAGQAPQAKAQLGYPAGNWPPAAGPSAQPDAIVTSAIRANPLTAPYAINATWRNGSIVLKGRVGTSVVHDMAVRTVIDLGYRVRDDLVIDTGEAHRVAMAQAAAARGPWAAPVAGSLAGSAPYFVYPPPLFGRVDDPFFGLEPPLLSFAPWATSGNPDSRVRQAGMMPGGVTGLQGQGPRLGQGSAPVGPQAVSPNAQTGQVAGQSAPIKGNLQLTVDMSGQVFLSGVVASEQDKQIIENEVRNTPGVSQVYSDLHVATQPTSETPPPPPQPVLRPDIEVEAVPAPSPAATQSTRPEAARDAQAQVQPQASRPNAEPPKRLMPDLAMARDGQKLTRRVAEALARRAPLAGLPISVHSHGDVVTLGGRVPSAYEAMLAYRTVEQTPGVREITDQLQFEVPDENHPNPLRQKGRPEDLEPYLTSQIRRHVGELAHVDRVRVRGDILEIQGTIPAGDDVNRLQAILRSMPLLRDFRLEPTFHAE